MTNKMSLISVTVGFYGSMLLGGLFQYLKLPYITQLLTVIVLSGILLLSYFLWLKLKRK
jgi:hypothetical protein